VKTLRTMTVREMREHATAGLVAFVIIGLLLVASYGMSQPGIRAFGRPVGVGTEMTTTVEVGVGNTGLGTGLSLFMLSAALAALMLGRAVTRDDRYGDARAFLLHRPADASLIFASKAIAAALLYLVAAGVPMLLHAAWLAVPGHRAAPYDARLMLPDVADLCAGLAYVFAGMLMTLRAKRFFDRGVFALGGAIICSVLVLSVNEFWQALLAVVVGVIVTGIAARATFTAIGGYESQPRGARLALGVNVLLGVQIAGLILYAILSLFQSAQASEDFRTTSTVLDSHGQFVRVTTSFGGIRSPGERVIAVTDLQGRPIPEYADSASWRHIGDGVLAAPEMPLVPDRWFATMTPTGYRAPDRVYQQLYAGGMNLLLWYYIPRQGLVAAYDPRTARQIGWLGPAGFHEGLDEPSERFAGTLRAGPGYFPQQMLFTFSHAVYRASLEHRAIQRIFMAPPGETVASASLSESTENPFLPRGGDSGPPVDSTQRFYAVATDRAVYVQSMAGTPVAHLAHDPSVAGYGIVTVVRPTFAPGTPTFVRYSPRWGTLDRHAEAHAPERVFEIRDGSTVAARYTLPETSHPPESHTDWTTPVAAFGVPLVERVAERVNDIILGNAPGDLDTPLMWTLTVLAALISAAAVIAIARRYAFDARRTVAWAVVALAFGLNGLVLMLALVSRPARERCPHCGRMRVVSPERCEHCGAAFAPPAPDGTEIFGAETITAAV